MSTSPTTLEQPQIERLLHTHSPRLGRAIFFGVLGVIVTALLVTQAEMVLSTIRIGYLQLPPVALGLLLVTFGMSQIARRISARLGLSQAELLVVYMMMVVAAMVSSHGVAQKLVPLLVIPNYFADHSNNWDLLFGSKTPSVLVPYHPMGGPQQLISVYYYEKLPRGSSIPWHAWLTPLVTWGILIALVLFAFLCLASLLRRSWVDQERLSFPLAQVPIQLVAEGEASIFRKRIFWVGALIPAVVYTVNGLHQNLPIVPTIPVMILLNDFLVTPPWNGLDYTPVLISFAAIGFFYLLPVDISLSIWLFFVLSRVAQAGSVSWDVDPVAFQASLKSQTIGAYVILVGMMAWSSKDHWKSVLSAAIGRSRYGHADELMPYPVAFWGLIGSVLLSTAWLWYMGMSLWLALLELGVCVFLIAPVMARSTAEAGLMMTETTFRPIDIYALFAPAHALGAANLTMVTFMDSMFLRDQRGLLLTGVLDALRIGDATPLPRRRLLPVFGVGLVVALVVSVGLNIFLPYHLGALSMDHWLQQGSSRGIFRDDAAIMLGATPELPAWSKGGSALAGAAITAALYLLRRYFYAWPLHPLGYALVGTWSTTEFWFPCLVAWLLKSLSLRYGGSQFVSRVTPFFLGMVIGEFGMAVLFVVLNICFHIEAPPFPWG